MPTDSVVERRKPWEEHNVFVAGLLAILVPGLGHLYQRRTIKGLIYLLGILGLFLWGVKLGEGMIIYNLPEKVATRRITLQYAAQFGAGLVAYPALWQQQRALKNNPTLRQLSGPLTAHFSGRLIDPSVDSAENKLEGTVKLESVKGELGPETKGEFVGTLDGRPIELALGGDFFLDRRIAAGYRRELRCGVIDKNNERTRQRVIIDGSIPRPFYNSYGVPPEPEQLQEVTGRLGKQHELALVFTWIAGLLNILAVWDCIQGPAYGFGDEVWAGPKRDDKPEPSPVPATNPTIPV